MACKPAAAAEVEEVAAAPELVLLDAEPDLDEAVIVALTRLVALVVAFERLILVA